MLAWYRAAARGGMASQVRRGFPEIDVPTLVLWGEDDVFLGKETTFGTHRYVRDLALHYLPGASHWVQQDAAGRVNDELRAFLSS
jgi:pimeloyl-ACP methyl ester carboxylesterase